MSLSLGLSIGAPGRKSSLLTGLLAHWPFTAYNADSLSGQLFSLGVGTSIGGTSGIFGTKNLIVPTTKTASHTSDQYNWQAGAFGLSVWYKRTGAATGTNIAVGYALAGVRSFYLVDTGALIGFYGASGDAAAVCTYAAAVANDTWVHLGATGDGAGNVELYYNGALVATKASFGALINKAGGSLFCGNITGFTSPQTVNVNLLTAENRRMAASEMASLYNNGLGLAYPF